MAGIRGVVSSRMAAISSPFASAGVSGATTFSPGVR